jgi:hypothetical protein
MAKRLKMKANYYIPATLIFCFLLAAGAFSQSPTDSALHRRAIFQSPLTYKLSKSFTQSTWGTPLFINGRQAIMQYVTMNPYTNIVSIATFHLDQAWNRMVYQEYPKPWIRAYGSQGNGVGEFLWPRSIDAQSFCTPLGCLTYYRIYIADADNKRIVCLRYGYGDENLVWDHAFTHDDLILPTDLNINNGGTFEWKYDDYIWVVDGCKIRRFDQFDNLRSSYGTCGCTGEVGQFCNPTAVVCGRTYMPEDQNLDPNSDNRYFYVADPGNNRIVWLEKDSVSENISWLGSVSTEGSFIVDLEVDNFGQLWALDRDGGRVIKYAYDLFPLCTYDTTGAGEHQFFWPLGISNPGGYWGCGNILVTESWSDTSGLQIFDCGTDIVDLAIEHSTDARWHYIRYVLIDPSNVTVAVYTAATQQLVKTIREGSEISGESFYVWDGLDNTDQPAPSGTYIVAIRDTSLYWDLETQEPAYTVGRNSDAFSHVLNPYTGYIPGDVNNDGNINIADVVYLTTYIFAGGDPPQPYDCVGDVNADYAINIGDTVFLVNYIFKGGPGPNDGCAI